VNKADIRSENDEFQVLMALKLSREKRAKLGEVFIEGIEPIKQASRAGVEITRIVSAGGKLSDWARGFIAEHAEARLLETSPALYGKLCDREEPSELFVTAKAAPLGLGSLSLPASPLVFVCDRPSDCGNLGSIVRSANSFGVDAVLLLGHGVDPYDPKSIRASLGTVFHTRIAKVESMREFGEWIDRLKASCGLRLVGTDSSGEVSIAERRLGRPIALVLGNEAKGMSVALRALCDFVARIPIEGAANSLNLACAASIFLWEIAGKSRAGE
jgi:23S rRNA (uridine2479-2'-O)-methyltransferase